MTPQPPPSNVDLEKSVLCTILLGIEDGAKLISELEERDFYDGKNKEIFKKVKESYSSRDPYDAVAVGAKVSTDMKVYLASLLDFPPITSEEWALSQLRAFNHLRQFIVLGNSIMKRGFQGEPSSVQDGVKFLQSSVLSLTESLVKRGWEKIGDVIIEALERADMLSKTCGISGVPTGFYDIDHVLCGLQKGDLVIVAARPAMGKTAFATNCAANAAEKGKRVGFFSLEMDKIQIANRLLAMYGGVDGTKFLSGRFTSEEFDKISSISSVMFNWGISVDDTPTATYQDIYHRTYQLKQTSGVDVIFIDYLSFLDGDRKGDNRVLEIQTITRGLKRVAKELDVAVVLISQLNRQCEMRPNKRPILSDLRESGAAEQDADVVIFLYRHAYYMKLEGKNEDENGNENPEYSKIKNLAEVIIAKHRNGPTGTVGLFWDENTTRFRDLARDGGRLGD